MKFKHFLQELDNPICAMGEIFRKRHCGGIISVNQLGLLVDTHDTSREVLVAVEEHLREVANTAPQYTCDKDRADEVKALIEHLDNVAQNVTIRVGKGSTVGKITMVDTRA